MGYGIVEYSKVKVKFSRLFNFCLIVSTHTTMYVHNKSIVFKCK